MPKSQSKTPILDAYFNMFGLKWIPVYRAAVSAVAQAVAPVVRSDPDGHADGVERAAGGEQRGAPRVGASPPRVGTGLGPRQYSANRGGEPQKETRGPASDAP